MSAISFSLPFLRKERLAKDVYAYYFKRSNKLDFLSGQYVQIILLHDKVDDRGTSRFFTIASSPTEKEHLIIISRRGRSSFKNALFHLQTGTEVKFFGPIGTFVLPED